ncbi:hypothetical protein ABGB18_17140 [Nonomuraea sp. B12E4]|uniref:hypothetical protein n=1 Tax=Nonomuraea sp. B12E4 TaxID=3153564 RepID=UPI00325F5165
MPQRQDGPPARLPQSEPFEVTGAFALPTNPAGGFPPANDPAGAFNASARQASPPPADEAGPFETTGAFARPPEWDQPHAGPADRQGSFRDPDRSSFFGGPGGDALEPADQPPFFRGPAADQTFFPGAPSPDQTAFLGDPAADQTAFLGGPAAGGTGPADQTAFFDNPAAERTAFFDNRAADQKGGFGASSGPNPLYGPPEPGDVKVAGEPTQVQTPAWASAETGFLGSGWSGDDVPPDQDEPRGRRGRRKGGRSDEVLAAPSGGKGKVALLSVAAVALVLGGTVAGVKYMSSSGGPGDCVDTKCAAVHATSNQPAPQVSEPTEEETEPTEEPPPSEEGTPEESASAENRPTPAATYARPRPTPTPTPTKARVKAPAEPTEDPFDVPVEESSPEETPTDTPSRLDDTSAGNTGGTVDLPQNGGGFEPDRGGGGNGGRGGGNGGTGLEIKQNINQRTATYSATLQVSNATLGTLLNPTISLPVTGRVMDVQGAQWTQDGDLLILDVPKSLAGGASINVTFTATGTGQPAENCGLVTGECVIS